MSEPTATEPQKDRRDHSRALAIAFFGPAVGSAIMLVVMLVLAPPFNEPDALDMLWRFAALILIIGYMAGSVPSILSALIWHFGLSRLEHARLRTIASIVTGAVAGSLFVWPAIELMFGIYAPDPHFYIYTAVAGTFALLVTARPWRQA